MDPIAEWDLLVLTRHSPDELAQEKDEVLQEITQRGVLRLTNVSGKKDPEWVCQILQAAAVTLKELAVYDVNNSLLRAMQGMRLEKLVIGDTNFAQGGQLKNFKLHLPSRLIYLRVWGLPRPLTVSMLTAHAERMEELWLQVDCHPVSSRYAEHKDTSWISKRVDLAGLLGECRLVTLKKLVLWRHGTLVPHLPDPCRAQREAVSFVVPPECSVKCNKCDGVAIDPF